MSALASRLRLAGLAMLYGAAAGVLAQLTLQGMTSLQHLVWAGPAPWWRIAATICAGGALLIVLRRISEPLSMAELLRADPTDRAKRHRIILVTALSGIVSIAFGGAVGPEAGLLAVIAQVSVLVGHFITRDLREERMLHSASIAGALSGLYASPPGAAATDDGELGPQKLLQVLAGVAGFFAFMFCSKVVFGNNGIAAVQLDDGAVTWRISLVAAVGAAAGFAFQWLHHALARVARLVSRPMLATAADTLAFAALAAALPIVRFSGHHEIEQLETALEAGSGALLFGAAVAKVLALALCLAAGWRGGEFFPLVFIGAGAGASLLLGADAGPGMAAGMAAAVVAGWGKPVAAFLIIILFVTGAPILAVLIGVRIGWVAITLLPLPEPEADPEPAAATSE
ncbi:H+/Cl- antiporter ClcA [Arthrobacter sp. AG1021]|uniref:chloride channel protein n=1 Tax=Arthrobacter sp. AG1021 TaxID=2183908 RepID=UPI000EB3CC46|nr:chloride channel protein [Arthrobacter sp. AG1021]RKS18075.1 H+/Cl- antiporter ClcA [Arthrobacter sp. AG1021]